MRLEPFLVIFVVGYRNLETNHAARGLYGRAWHEILLDPPSLRNGLLLDMNGRQ